MGRNSEEVCLEAVLDTSAIMFAVERRVDLLELVLSVPESICKIVIPSSVINELDTLAKGGGLRSKVARAALEVIEVERRKHSSIIEIIDTGEISAPVDDVILTVASKGGRVVITADRKMKKKARALGIYVYSVAKASLSAR